MRKVQVGRLLVLAVALLWLAGCAGRFSASENAQLEGLVALARTDLEGLLGVQAEVIALESISAAAFPCPSDACVEEPPSYVIRLIADGQLYQYQAKEVSGMRILWREVPVQVAPLTERISVRDQVSVATQ